ncbi:MAG: nascent polypeptide-associated complex protein [Thermoplasmata archaeon]|nr:MAG: nascent polypeptide-associated complex protein [Thermoplasmata archaeon]HDO69711.1 nascent polypeptide-associated complex protein [Thermoplasmatales archaeon]HEX17626.1 nascent polypeptide-associated complex protein [Thermoplasmatales archaeon]
MLPKRFNPRQISQLMKQLGINIREIEDVEEVIIRTKDKEYIFKQPEVTLMDAHGQKTYQIIGTPQIKEKGFPEEDIKLVMEKTGRSREEAERALRESKGDIAEAILKLMEG